MRQPLLIHVGYHKTATTWLQQALFTGRFGYRKVMTHEDVFETIVRPHGLMFDSAAARARIDRCSEGETETNVDVISSEILCGNPFYGGRESDQFARRLHEIAPDALILITIREQFSAMTSLYMQYLSRAGTMSAKEFFSDAPAIGYLTFAPEHLQFHRLVHLYREMFGPDHVLVIAKESIDRDLGGVIDRIGRYCGNGIRADLGGATVKRVGVSYPEFSSVVLRRLNHIRSGPLNMTPPIDLGLLSDHLYRGTGAFARHEMMMRLFDRWRPITTLVRARFRGRFAESNKALKATLGAEIDLTGYELVE